MFEGGVLDALDCWVLERGQFVALGKVVKGVKFLIGEVAGEVQEEVFLIADALVEGEVVVDQEVVVHLQLGDQPEGNTLELCHIRRTAIGDQLAHLRGEV